MFGAQTPATSPLFEIMARDDLRLAEVDELHVREGDAVLLEAVPHRVVAGRVRGQQDALPFRLRVGLDGVELLAANHQDVGLGLVVGDADRQEARARRAEHGRDRARPADVPRLRLRGRDLRRAGREDREARLEADLLPPALLGRDVVGQRPVERRLIADVDRRLRRRRGQAPRRSRRRIAKAALSSLPHGFLLRAGRFPALLTMRVIARRTLFSSRSERQTCVRRCTKDSRSITSSIGACRSHFSAGASTHVDDLLDAPRPAGHHDDAVGEIDGLLDAVSDEEDRPRIDAGEPDQLLLHHDARLRVERAERLVHQEHVGLEHIGARDGDALLHAAGELVRKGALVALQVHERDAIATTRSCRSASGRPCCGGRGRCCRARVFHGNSANCWKTTARSGPGAVTGRPPTLTTPALGNSNPAAMRRHVVLPHPDGPTIATNSFSATARSTRSTAGTSAPARRKILLTART